MHLRWAFDNCTLRSHKNKRSILIPLVASYLILGRYPQEALLATAGLEPVFSGLIYRLKKGDAAGAMDELDKNMDWFRVRGLYLIMKEKLQISMWRNLSRRWWVQLSNRRKHVPLPYIDPTPLHLPEQPCDHPLLGTGNVSASHATSRPASARRQDLLEG